MGYAQHTGSIRYITYIRLPYMSHSPDCNTYTDNQLLTLLAEDTAWLKCIQERTREYCIKFMHSIYPTAGSHQLTDIYHDALIVLYEKCRDRQLQLTCSLQTYLNSVCRNQLLQQLRQEARNAALQESYIAGEYDKHITDWLHPAGEDINTERVQAIVKALAAMKHKGDCYELLQLVHYKGLSMKQVAAHFGYSNEQIARNKNYLCREKLKTIAYSYLNKKK